MRGPSIKRSLIFFIVLALIIWSYIFFYHRPTSKIAKPWELIRDEAENSRPQLSSPMQTQATVQATNEPVQVTRARTVLIFTEYERSKFLVKLVTALESQRISYDILTWNRFEVSELSLPRLLDERGQERYTGFIFDNIKIYDLLDEWTKLTLHNYCQLHEIGIVLLSAIDYKKEADYVKLKSIPLWIKYSVKDLYDVELNHKSSVLQITKADQILKFQHRAKHTVLWSNHSSFEPVSFSYRDDTPVEKSFVLDDTADGSSHQENVYRVNRSKFVTIMYDKGEFDGIKRIIFGGRMDSLWLYKLVFLDALSVISKGALGRPLTQWMLIDIDDIFVAHSGTRLKKDDVEVCSFFYPTRFHHPIFRVNCNHKFSCRVTGLQTNKI